MEAPTLVDNTGKIVSLDMGDIEYIQYRNANARMWDVTKDGEVLKGDPHWYMVKEDGVKYQPKKDSVEWKNKDETNRNDAILIDIASLVPGDIIQYEADDSGKLLRISMVYRCEYPGDVEFSYKEDGLHSTGLGLNYRGGNLSLSGTVKKVFDSDILAEINLPEGASTGSSTTLGLPLDYKTTRILPTNGKFVVWDVNAQEMREISPAEIMEGDEIFAWWQTMYQRLVVIYR